MALGSWLLALGSWLLGSAFKFYSLAVSLRRLRVRSANNVFWATLRFLKDGTDSLFVRDHFCHLFAFAAFGFAVYICTGVGRAEKGNCGYG